MNDFRLDNGKPLGGEIQCNVILIYENREEKALQTLNHEFVEYLLYPTLQALIDKNNIQQQMFIEMINKQNKLILKMIIEKKEEFVDKMVKSMR